MEDVIREGTRKVLQTAIENEVRAYVGLFKELVAVLDGYLESKLSWTELLSFLKERGLTEGPKLAIGDGGLGFWAVLRESYLNTKEQRRWPHKTANILDKMPKSVQPKAKEKIHDIYLSPTREEALVAYNSFLFLYSKKFPEACEYLSKDKDVLFTFYESPQNTGSKYERLILLNRPLRLSDYVQRRPRATEPGSPPSP